MKNILIPTDFSIKSLKLAGAAVRRYGSEQLNITLVHALQPDNSISGLLMLNKRQTNNKLCSEEFMEACEIVKNKYSSNIHKIKVEFYYGSTRAYLNSFLDARAIDVIILANDYALRTTSTESVDMMFLAEQTKCQVQYESILKDGYRAPVEEASISELLHV